MKTVIIAGGGTGGHIYPALAIAKSLQEQNQNIQIHFVGTNEGLEKKIIPKEGFPLHFIQGGKLNFSGQPFLKLWTLIKMPVAFFQSVQLILTLKPDVVLGVGGYASGPFVMTAALMRRPCAIWEANVLPGLANRMLSKWVRVSYLVFDETKKYLNSATTKTLGMPVRREIEEASGIEVGEDNKVKIKTEGEPLAEIGSQKMNILHFGGSQGSRVIGRTLCEVIEKFPECLEDIHFTHQTGSVDFLDFQKRYEKFQSGIDVKEFIYNMPDYYRKADLVIARAGASTLSELAAFGLPAIVIPLPAADGHQEYNARGMADAGAIAMINQKDLTPERLYEEIERLRKSPETLIDMKRKIQQFFTAKAAEKIARDLLSLK